MVIIGSLFERRAAGVYHNTAVVLDADGSLLGIYRKMHIPDDPLYYEKFYFTPGDLGFPNFDTRFGRIARAGLLGPMVSGRRAAGGARRSATSFFIRRRSAGIPPRKRNTARRNWTPGGRSNARTRSPMEFMWRQ